MRYIHFVINPISGNGVHNLTAALLRTYFPRSEFRVEVDLTRHKKHAIELTKNILSKNPDIVVACGGDGTINEVASCLVGTDILFGVIPLGSGNGLASNLKISKNIETAVFTIRTGNHISIDVGKVNEYFFFSNMGIGIDAQIIKKYEGSAKRKLSAYISAALSASSGYKGRNTRMVLNDQIKNITPLLLFISNSNEMGYKMSLTPKASLQDNWLDLVVVPELSFLKKILLGYYVLRNKIEDFKLAEHNLIRKLDIEIPDAADLDIQIDGEYYKLETNVLQISIAPMGLRVIV